MSRTSFGATRDHAQTLIDQTSGSHRTATLTSTLYYIETPSASTMGARFDLIVMSLMAGVGVKRRSRKGKTSGWLACHGRVVSSNYPSGSTESLPIPLIQEFNQKPPSLSATRVAPISSIRFKKKKPLGRSIEYKALQGHLDHALSR